MSAKNDKRFDDFPTADCNECEHWWLNQCDGVQKAQKRPCTTFKATRSVVIPQEIKWLRTRLKWLIMALVCLGISQAITILILYFECFGG